MLSGDLISSLNNVLSLVLHLKCGKNKHMKIALNGRYKYKLVNHGPVSVSYLKGLAHAKIIKKSVISFRLLNMTI